MKQLEKPEHIAIIMDGNGRWAKKRFLPRIAGHKAGVEAAKRIIKACITKKIQVLTLFAFSRENWRRPEQEVSFLMDLFYNGLDREILMLHEHNVKLRFIGERSNFNLRLKEKIEFAENLTVHNTGLVLLIAADYGGQWDLTQACKKIAMQVANNSLSPQEITPELISANLCFADLPNPDLFIRTSGEVRLSNFMLWQLAYSELFFTDVLWPDFDESHLDIALNHFSSRERRFGFCSEQLQNAESAVCSNNV